MKSPKKIIYYIILLCLLVNPESLFSQSKGIKSISENELRSHLEFIAAPEFRGRPSPSQGLDIVTLYLGNWARNVGLKPIFKDGSFYQSIPVNVSTVSESGTRIRISNNNGERIFYYNTAFGGNLLSRGTFSGNVVFAGLGLSNPEYGWDDLKDLNLNGKIVLILDEQLPDNKSAGLPTSYRLVSRLTAIRNRGAAAVFSIISQAREEKLIKGTGVFEYTTYGGMVNSYDTQRTSFPSPAGAVSPPVVKPPLPFAQVEISHEVAAEIMGISKSEITGMLNQIKLGQQVPSKNISDVRVQLEVEKESHESITKSVIGVVEGSDPVLKNEYIVVCAHHDHIGVRYGEVIAGADDNGSGTVALIGIAKALLNERPKRSVIIAWFTGEEPGLQGSHYFINNCPVPVEKISACLNMDMLGRNTPDSLYLVASNLLSSELDAAINKVNKQFNINFGFSYMYSNLTHPQRVYFRSDQYPLIRFGIPSVWFFCGFTPDYHTPKDVLEYVDYNKLCRSARLIYLTAYEIGNLKEMLKLDVNPAVTSRGKHNVTEKSLFQAETK